MDAVKKKKPTHFESCTDKNCKRKWCVDRREAKCKDNGGCLVEEYSDRCVDCHVKYYCSGYGWCDLHGEHGP